MDPGPGRAGTAGGERREEPAPAASPAPTRSLGLVDAVALTVGVVLGAGIFKAPSLVAAYASSDTGLLLVWLLGGVASVVGAVCYAELATTYPHAGGDYHFLQRALGQGPAYLFAWARLTVIPTGSIALLAFVFGDYATELLPLGRHSPAVYAALLVVLLTALNVAGLRQGTRTQRALTLLEVVGVVGVIVAGLTLSPAAAPAPPAATTPGTGASWGLAMVLVLLTYGGWNEAAYLSAEVRGPRRSLAWALLLSLGVVTLLYVLVNVAYLRGLGLGDMGASEAVAADLLRRALGDWGARGISVLIALSALTSANATIFTGARTSFAFGRDSHLFRALGRWSPRADTPVRALLAQGVLTLLLVGIGALTRSGFETMVQYTAPVFWLFFLLTGISLLVLRVREPDVPRPFRVPLYPLTPLLFCGICAWLLYASLAYSGWGALVGVAVLAVGGLVLALEPRRSRPGRRERVPPPSPHSPKEAT